MSLPAAPRDNIKDKTSAFIYLFFTLLLICLKKKSLSLLKTENLVVSVYSENQYCKDMKEGRGSFLGNQNWHVLLAGKIPVESLLFLTLAN